MAPIGYSAVVAGNTSGLTPGLGAVCASLTGVLPFPDELTARLTKLGRTFCLGVVFTSDLGAVLKRGTFVAPDTGDPVVPPTDPLACCDVAGSLLGPLSPIIEEFGASFDDPMDPLEDIFMLPRPDVTLFDGPLVISFVIAVWSCSV